MNSLVLSGCRPSPLASYLKALGLFRIVAEQKDKSVKGFWQGEVFVLNTTLTQEDLSNFFVNEYIPAPIVSPWNGGSGFYMGDATKAIEGIRSSDDQRFFQYRKAIEEIRAWPVMPVFKTVNDVKTKLETLSRDIPKGKKRDKIQKTLSNIKKTAPSQKCFDAKNVWEVSFGKIEEILKEKKYPHRAQCQQWWNELKKARTDCNDLVRNNYKSFILSLCRARLPDSCVRWFDTVYTLDAEDAPSYNPLVGTGGNEGRLDLSNNYMQRLYELFLQKDTKKTEPLFISSVFEEFTTGLITGKIGQYDPGRAGGYNQGAEIETKNFKINPWDFVLGLEGTLVFAGALVRRNPVEGRSYFTSPFTVYYSSVGFPSGVDDNAGRYETWMPLWKKPASYQEIKYLFAEGRSTLGRRIARNGVDFSRAVATLGVDRGIDSFERYAFLQRRGQSKVALPAGRVKVTYSPDLDILNELDGMLGQIGRFLSQFKTIPASFQKARRQIDECIFSCSQQPNSITFSNLLRSVGRLDRLVSARDRSKEPNLQNPLYGLSTRWIGLVDDGTPEIRIAASLASICSTDKVGSLRSMIAGVDSSKPWQWKKRKDVLFWYGKDLADRLAGIVHRRILEAQKSAIDRVPFQGRLPLSPGDVMPFLYGECDDNKLEELLWGFSLINWNRGSLQTIRNRWIKTQSPIPLSRTWCVLKLLHHPYKIEGQAMKTEPRINNLLSAGRVQEACSVAVQRLRVSDLKPHIILYDEKLDSHRLSASLMIPVKDVWQLKSLVLQKTDDLQK